MAKMTRTPIAEVAPSILGLVKMLPDPGDPFPVERRERFMEALTALLDYLYSETCGCCGSLFGQPDEDPWEGRMNDYCVECRLARCDTAESKCPVKDWSR